MISHAFQFGRLIGRADVVIQTKNCPCPSMDDMKESHGSISGFSDNALSGDTTYDRGASTYLRRNLPSCSPNSLFPAIWVTF